MPPPRPPPPAHPTHTCSGTDLELPFKCPLDFLLPVGQLDAAGLEYRPAGFLDLPQVRVPQPPAAAAAVVVLCAAAQRRAAPCSLFGASWLPADVARGTGLQRLPGPPTGEALCRLLSHPLRA